MGNPLAGLGELDDIRSRQADAALTLALARFWADVRDRLAMSSDSDLAWVQDFATIAARDGLLISDSMNGPLDTDLSRQALALVEASKS
ncbi:MAG: hypothetical protein EPN91_02325 [Salinibacterium sp.]|nr:MAG: hypothetical protein EPN91_02325 [Salinibacterium sp.]